MTTHQTLFTEPHESVSNGNEIDLVAVGAQSGEPRTLASAAAILDVLDDQQREVATNLQGPLCVLAGAGTGKTRAITHRIAYAVATNYCAPQNMFAVTFTARAAAEMRSRLRDLGVPAVQARTFHAAALRQLQFFWPQVFGGSVPAIVEMKAPLLANAAQRLRLSVDKAALRDIAGEIEWAKVSMVTADTYLSAVRQAGRPLPSALDPTALVRLMRAYEEVKVERDVIDFEDVLLLTVGILEENPALAAMVRAQYRHFVVDEYQDVSGLQQRLLDLWLGERDSVCVVGDASQTIYSFAGASHTYLTGFQRRYPHATTVRLERDYRSTGAIVEIANTILDQAPAESVRHRVTLSSARESGPAVVVRDAADDGAQARAVAKDIAAHVKNGLRAKQCAVLYRTNGQAQAVEQALTDLGLGYVMKGGQRFFARPEIRDALVLLNGASRSVASDKSLPENVLDVLSATGWNPHATSLTGSARERWESLQALVDLAHDMAHQRASATLTDFLAELRERADAQHAPAVDGVTLSTIHAAKGLEWEAVFVIGVSEGLLPLSFAETPDAIEEERRLLYVAVTRAKTHLTLSWAASSAEGGRAHRKPSRFLPVSTETTVNVPKARKRSAKQGTSRCRTCSALLDTGAERKIGRCAECPPTYREELFDELKTWRSLVAKEAHVPAYVVFTDATLIALAESMPTSEQELLAIPGIGKTKAERYGAQVVAVLHGGHAQDVYEAALNAQGE